MLLPLPPAHHPLALAGAPATPPWLWLLAVTVAAAAGAAAAAVLTQRRWRARADALAQQAAAWRHRAYHDDLTGLPNRAGAYAWLQRRHGQPAGVVLLDLDQFKTVNDTHGHAAGDLVLHHVATHLHALMDGRGIAARLGGDEFLLLLDRPGDAADTAMQAAVLLRARPVPLGAHTLPCRASFGVATTDGDTDPDQLLARADIALFQAKKTPSGVVAYQPIGTASIAVVPRPALRRRDRRDGDGGAR
jgi:diguanylate cyclase (GGDEF)-like protein